MTDNAEIHTKILTFLSTEFARVEGRQCVSIDLEYSPGGGFKDAAIRAWARADTPELFDDFSQLERLCTQIVKISEDEAAAKPPGRHRFAVRTHQLLGGRATMSLALPGQASSDYSSKPPTPLQAVVGVICDSLADLSPSDQTRALEAVRITLGIR